jgi:hypothetical protein
MQSISVVLGHCREPGEECRTPIYPGLVRRATGSETALPIEIAALSAFDSRRMNG